MTKSLTDQSQSAIRKAEQAVASKRAQFDAATEKLVDRIGNTRHRVENVIETLQKQKDNIKGKALTAVEPLKPYALHVRRNSRIYLVLAGITAAVGILYFWRRNYGVREDAKLVS